MDWFLVGSIACEEACMLSKIVYLFKGNYFILENIFFVSFECDMVENLDMFIKVSDLSSRNCCQFSRVSLSSELPQLSWNCQLIEQSEIC